MNELESPRVHVFVVRAGERRWVYLAFSMEAVLAQLQKERMTERVTIRDYGSICGIAQGVHEALGVRDVVPTIG